MPKSIFRVKRSALDLQELNSRMGSTFAAFKAFQVISEYFSIPFLALNIGTVNIFTAATLYFFNSQFTTIT